MRTNDTITTKESPRLSVAEAQGIPVANVAQYVVDSFKTNPEKMEI